jgi:uncharacterized protein
VAVTGVSRHAKGHGSNVVYKRLRDRGYEVYAVNPNANKVEGDSCYHDLRSAPGGVASAARNAPEANRSGAASTSCVVPDSICLSACAL